MLLSKIKPLYFFASLFIGLMFTYVFTPTPDIIYQYPSPENAGKITYMDNANICYKYKSNKVNCPKDKNKITYLIDDMKKFNLDKKNLLTVISGILKNEA